MRLTLPVVLVALAACNAPPEGGAISLSPAEPKTGDDVQLSIDEDAMDPQDHAVSYQIRWTRDGEAVSSLDDAQAVPSAETAKGQVWGVSVTPIDEKDAAGEPVSAEITIGNTAPGEPTLTLGPTQPTSQTDLTLAWEATDVDGDALTATAEWSVNGTPVTGDESGLSASNFTRDDVVEVSVTVGDDTDSSAAVTASVTIINTAPTAPGAVTLTPSRATVSTPITCTVGTPASDIDGDSLEYTYALVAGDQRVELPPTTDTSATFAAGTAPLEVDTRCEVVANDGDLDSDPGMSDSIRIAFGSDRVLSACGATGYEGPSAEDCVGWYSESEWRREIVVDAGLQTWTVPGNANYRITATGAQGGGTSGGLGAEVGGTFALKAGDTVTIIIGQQGGVTSQGSWYCGGGGGGTFVYLNAEDDEPLLIAGGGGGQSEYGCRVSTEGGDGSHTEDTTPGTGTGSGAGGTGGNGGSGGGIREYSFSTGGGGAGWLSDGQDGLDLRNPKGEGGLSPRSGGEGGIYTHPNYNGAHGGFGGGGGASDNTGAGGGGGGWNGGGGGNDYDGSCRWGSGGGGSSFNRGSLPTGRSGVNEGAGQVRISIDRPK